MAQTLAVATALCVLAKAFCNWHRLILPSALCCAFEHSRPFTVAILVSSYPLRILVLHFAFSVVSCTFCLLVLVLLRFALCKMHFALCLACLWPCLLHVEPLPLRCAFFLLQLGVCWFGLLWLHLHVVMFGLCASIPNDVCLCALYRVSSFARVHVVHIYLYVSFGPCALCTFWKCTLQCFFCSSLGLIVAVGIISLCLLHSVHAILLCTLALLNFALCKMHVALCLLLFFGPPRCKWNNVFLFWDIGELVLCFDLALCKQHFAECMLHCVVGFSLGVLVAS